MEQLTGLKDFLRAAAKKRGKEFDEVKADEFIKKNNYDYGKIVDDIGTGYGVKPEKLSKFREAAFQKYAITPLDDTQRAEIDFISTPEKVDEGLSGYEKYGQYEQERTVAGQLMSDLEKQGEEKVTPIAYTSMSQTAEPLVRKEMIYEPQIQARINDIKSKIGTIDQRMSAQATLNKKETGFISQQHKATHDKYIQYDKLFDDAIEQKLKGSTTTSIGGGAFGGTSITSYRPKDRKRVKDLRDIKSMYKKIGKVLEAPSGKDFQSQVEGLWHGLTQSNTARDFWSMGINEMSRNLNVKSAFDKFQSAKDDAKSKGVNIEQLDEVAINTLDEEEQALLETYQLLQNIQSGSRANTGAIVGEGLQDMIPFILEFAVTSGTSAAAKKVVKEFIKNRLKNATIAKIGGAITKVGTQAAIMPTTAKGYAERTAPTIGQFGELVEGESPGEAILKSYLTTAAEVIGEDAAIMGSKALRKKAIQNLANDPGKASKFINTVAARMSAETGIPTVQNQPFELFSEEVTGVLQAVIDNDGSFFTPEAQWQLFLMTSLAGGGAATFNAPKRVIAKQSFKKAETNLNDLTNTEFSKTVKNITESIADPEEQVKAFDQASKGFKIDEEEYNIGKNYVLNSIRMNQVSTTRSVQIEKGIQEFGDDNGSISTFEHDGQKWYIKKGVNDTSNPDRIVIAKNDAGQTKPFSNKVIGKVFTQTPEEVNNDINMEDEAMEKEYIQQEAIQKEAADRGIEVDKTVKTPQGNATVTSINDDGTITAAKPNGEEFTFKAEEVEVFKTQEQKDAEKAEVKATEQEKKDSEQAEKDELAKQEAGKEVVSESEEELPDGTKIRVANLADGTATLETPEGEQVFNTTEERDNALKSIVEEKIESAKGDIDQLAPEERFKELGSKNPKIARTMLQDDINELNSQAKELAKAETATKQERLDNLTKAEELETEAARLETLLELTDEELTVSAKKTEAVEEKVTETDGKITPEVIEEEVESPQKEKPTSVSGSQKEQSLDITEKASGDLKERKLAVDALADLQEEFGIPVKVIHESEMSDTAKAAAKGKGITPRAYYENGNAYVLSNKLTKVSEIKKDYLHEAILHKGLDAIFEKGEVTILGKKYETKQDLLMDVFGMLDEEMIATKAKEYGINLEDPVTDKQRQEIAEEILAEFNELENVPSKLNNFVNSLWKWFRTNIGFSKTQFTKTDLLNLLTDHRNLVKETVAKQATIQEQEKVNKAEALFDEFQNEQKNAPASQLTEWQKSALSETFSRDSFTRTKDENEITGTIARAWLNKSGKAIDTFVSEQEYNREEGGVGALEPFTIDDVLDFIMKYPSKNVRKTTGRMNEIRAEYKGLTGTSINNHKSFKDKAGVKPEKKSVAAKTEEEIIYDEAMAKLASIGVTPEQISRIGSVKPDITAEEATVELFGEDKGDDLMFRGEKVKDIVEKVIPKVDRKVKFRVGQEETEITESDNFKRWSKGAPILKQNEMLDTEPGKPQVFKVHHGTTNEFYVFDPTVKGAIESHFGLVNYFTSDEYDADKNYAGMGPDLTNRVENLKERIEQDIFDNTNESYEEMYDYVSENYPDFDVSSIDEDLTASDIAQRISENKYVGGEGKIMDLYVRLDNPAVINGSKETWIEPFDEETVSEYRDQAKEEILEENDVTEEDVDEYENEINERFDELMQDEESVIISAAQQAAWKNGVDEQVVIAALPEEASYGSESVSASAINKSMRENEELSYSENDEGELISTQIIADLFQELGFDGIVLAHAKDQFSNMYMDPNASHVHLFADNPNQVKLADGENIEFGETEDIRFRTQDQAPLELKIEQLNKQRERIVAEKKRLTKQANQRNGLFGDTQADAGDLFGGGGQGFNPQAIMQKEKEFNAEIQRIDKEVALLKKQNVTGKVEDSGQMTMFKVAPKTDTKAFKNWFKDSKVVDENGEPLVVYHGTPDVRSFKDRQIFDKTIAVTEIIDEDKRKELQDKLNEEAKRPNHPTDEYFKILDEVPKNKRTISKLSPAFFTENKGVASTYADDRRSFDYQGAEAQIIPVYLSIKNPKIIYAGGKGWGERGGYSTQIKQIEEARNDGHDGLIIKRTKDSYHDDSNTIHDVYVTFNSPTQIKSTANQGTFDPENADIRFKVEKAATEANTNPSEDQKHAGNYKMGHVAFDGFDISIENPKGSTRSGTDNDGKEWSRVMPAQYGYFKGTVGKDKDHIDVFIGDNPETDKIYVIDQVDPKTGKFDEHKIMLGFDNVSKAKNTYNSAYESGWKGLGEITRTDKEGLKEWFKGDTKKPYGDVRFKITEQSTSPEIANLFEKLNAIQRVSQANIVKKDLERAAKSTNTPEFLKDELKEKLNTFREGIKAGTKYTKDQIDEIESSIVDYIGKNLDLGSAGARDIKSAFTALRKAKRSKLSVERAFDKIDELTGKVDAKKVKNKNVGHIKRLMGWMKNTDNFVYANNAEFKTFREIDRETIRQQKVLNSPNSTTSEKKAAEDALDSMWNELDAKVEERTMLEDVQMKLIEYRRNKADASDELIASIREDLQIIYDAAKDAKKGEDIQKAIDRKSDREFVKSLITEQPKDKKNWEQRARMNINNFAISSMGNWETLLNQLGGQKLRDKFTFLLKQSEREVSQQATFDKVLDQAREGYGLKSKEDMLKHVTKLNEKEFELVKPNREGERGQGAPLSLSRMDIMDIYNAIKNKGIQEDAYMTYGDISLAEDGKRDTDAQMKSGKKRIDGLISNLSEGDKLFADAMQVEADAYYSKYNNVFIKTKNRDLPKMDNYWPSSAEFANENDAFEQFRQDAMRPSATQERTKHRVVKIGNAFDKFVSHVKQGEWYDHMAIPVTQMNNIIKNPNVKDLIVENRGQDFYDTMISHLQEQELFPPSKSVKRSGIENVAGQVLNNWVSAAIGLSPSVPVKQLLSVINYAENMPPGKWAAGFAKGLAGPKAIKETWDEMMKIPYLRTRVGTGYSEALQYVMAAEEGSPRATTAWQKMKNYMTAGTRYGDITAIVFGGKPYLDYLVNEKGMSYKDAVDQFLLDTLRSQQSPFSSSLSTWQNSKDPIKRSMFAFSNTPAQYQRKMFEANEAMNRGDISKGQLAKVYTIYGFLSSANYIIVGALMSALLSGSDWDDDLKKKIFVQLCISAVGGMPIIKDVAETLARTMSGMDVYDDVNPIVEGFGKLIEVGEKLANADEKTDTKKLIATGIKYFTPFFGVSSRNIEKVYKATVKRKKTFTETKGKITDEHLTQIAEPKRKIDIELKGGDFSSYYINTRKRQGDYREAEAADKLRKSYAKAKREATGLEAKGSTAKAEKIRKLIDSSKYNLSKTDYLYGDIEAERSMLNKLVEKYTR